jgi:hypothetical protein
VFDQSGRLNTGFSQFNLVVKVREEDRLGPSGQSDQDLQSGSGSLLFRDLQRLAIQRTR